MRDIYFFFYKQRVYAFENDGKSINELKLFENNNYSTYELDIYDNVKLLPDEIPYIKGHSQAFDVIYKDGIAAILLCEYMALLLDKIGSYDSFYILLDGEIRNHEYVNNSFAIAEKNNRAVGFKGLYFISNILYGILLSINKKILIVDDNFCVGIGKKLSGVVSNFYSPFAYKEHPDIENIYYTYHFDKIYDVIPKMFIGNIIGGAITNYMYNVDEDINVVSRDRRIIISHEHNKDYYKSNILESALEILAALFHKDCIIYTSSKSQRYIDDLKKVYSINTKQIISNELFFEYFKVLIKINEDRSVKFEMKRKKRYTLCFIRKDDNINNKSRFENMLRDVVKKYFVNKN